MLGEFTAWIRPTLTKVEAHVGHPIHFCPYPTTGFIYILYVSWDWVSSSKGPGATVDEADLCHHCFAQRHIDSGLSALNDDKGRPPTISQCRPPRSPSS